MFALPRLTVPRRRQLLAGGREGRCLTSPMPPLLCPSAHAQQRIMSADVPTFLLDLVVEFGLEPLSRIEAGQFHPEALAGARSPPAFRSPSGLREERHCRVSLLPGHAQGLWVEQLQLGAMHSREVASEASASGATAAACPCAASASTTALQSPCQPLCFPESQSGQRVRAPERVDERKKRSTARVACCTITVLSL